MLMSYVLDAGRFGHSLDALAPRYFSHAAVDYNDVIGPARPSRVRQCRLGEAAPTWPRMRHFAAARPGAKARMIASNVMTVYETLERPLLPVCAQGAARHLSGPQVLSRLRAISRTRRRHSKPKCASWRAIRSSIPAAETARRLAVGKMPVAGRTKTRPGNGRPARACSMSLAEQGLELPQKILAWRQAPKLKSTYTDRCRLRQSRDQARAYQFTRLAGRDGRLSSSSRTCRTFRSAPKRGVRSASAFVATDGHKLVSAELIADRVAPARRIADVPALRQASRRGSKSTA